MNIKPKISIIVRIYNKPGISLISLIQPKVSCRTKTSVEDRILFCDLLWTFVKVFAVDFMIIKEVLHHAYEQYQNDLKRNPNIKLDQIRLLSSYEYVLRQYGIDPLTDGFFYKILMKIESSSKNKLDLFKALEKEI